VLNSTPLRCLITSQNTRPVERWFAFACAGAVSNLIVAGGGFLAWWRRKRYAQAVV
jgi:hypothetical protein